MQPDLILHNATVRTMDGDRPLASAVAVAGNRIVAVGDENEVTALAGPQTRMIDAGGGTLLPGFYESHLHLFAGGVSLSQLNVAAIFGAKALREAVQAFAAANPEADLLVAYGANYTMFGDDVRISRQLLDDAIADRPFYMIACDFHTGWGNTVAMERAGLLQGRDVGPSSEVVMGPDGTATGELREGGAMSLMLALKSTDSRENLGMAGAEPDSVTEAEREADIASLLEGMEYCARHGITVSLNLILFPDDTLEDVLATWRFALRCARAGAADVSYFPYLPYPGRALYQRLLDEGRLPPLSDDFLASLLDQFDLARSRSHNPRFSDALLQTFRFGLIASFMATVAARNPVRTVQAIRNVATGRPKTRVEKNLGDILRRLPTLAGLKN